MCGPNQIFLRRRAEWHSPQKMAETKLAGLKATEPNLEAFYDSLDAKAEEGVRHRRAHRRHMRLGGVKEILRNFGFNETTNCHRSPTLRHFCYAPTPAVQMAHHHAVGSIPQPWAFDVRPSRALLARHQGGGNVSYSDGTPSGSVLSRHGARIPTTTG